MTGAPPVSSITLQMIFDELEKMAEDAGPAMAAPLWLFGMITALQQPEWAMGVIQLSEQDHDRGAELIESMRKRGQQFVYHNPVVIPEDETLAHPVDPRG